MHRCDHWTPLGSGMLTDVSCSRRKQLANVSINCIAREPWTSFTGSSDTSPLCALRARRNPWMCRGKVGAVLAPWRDVVDLMTGFIDAASHQVRALDTP